MLHLLPEGGQLLGTRKLGFIILRVAADEEGCERSRRSSGLLASEPPEALPPNVELS